MFPQAVACLWWGNIAIDVGPGWSEKRDLPNEDSVVGFGHTELRPHRRARPGTVTHRAGLKGAALSAATASSSTGTIFFSNYIL